MSKQRYISAADLAKELNVSTVWVTRRATEVPGALKTRHETGICMVWQFPDCRETRDALRPLPRKEGA